MNSMLTFRCQGTLYAVDAETVLEVVELPAISPWPGAPAGVAGVIDYRGEIVPILDVAQRLGGLPLHPKDNEQLIVVQIGGGGPSDGKAALLVAEALELRGLLSPLRPLPSDVPSSLRHASRFLLGVTTLAEQVVLVLDLRALAEFLDDRPAPGLFAGHQEPSELLAQRARDLAVPLVGPGGEEQQSLVVVKLSGERLGIPVREVAELAACPAFTAVPGSPPHLLGLAYLRGSLLRVIDLRAMIGLDSTGPVPPEVVVLAGPGMPTGLVVDTIESVAKVAGSGSKLPYGEGWMTVLDLDRIDVREPRPVLEGGR